MASFEEKIEQATRDRDIGGAILIAKDKSGKLDYLKIVGAADLNDNKPPELDSVLLLLSATKLPTTIAVLQIVERGLVGLDDDLKDVLPALAAQPILSGFADDGTPVLRPRKNAITLRRLLTHSAGLGYDFKEKLLMDWHARNPPKYTLGTLDERFDYPLVYEPGEGWAYGPGIDYAGRVLEKVTGQTLEDYMREHLWRPLGADLTFWPGKQPAGFAARRWPMAARDPATGKVGPDTSGFDMNAGLAECFGGQGLYGTAPDYMKVLVSLLHDDEKLLGRATAALMFQPQLEPASHAALLAEFKVPDFYAGHYPDTGEYSWGFGGIVVDGDGHYRKRGTLTWAGAINTVWFVDRASGLCAIYGSQLLPPADKTNQALVAAFEKEMYDRLASLA